MANVYGPLLDTHLAIHLAYAPEKTCTLVYNGITLNREKLETIQMFISVEWTNKSRYIYTTNYYLVIRMYVLLLHATAQLNLTNMLIKIKPDTKEFLKLDFTYIKLKNRQH